MLVLTRKVGEIIHVGDTIQVKVVELNGSSVKLGIEAPRDIDVHREEIYRRIQRSNQRAARATRRGLSEVASLWKQRAEGPAGAAPGHDWSERSRLVGRVQRGEMPVSALCREAGITPETFLEWQEEWFHDQGERRSSPVGAGDDSKTRAHRTRSGRSGRLRRAETQAAPAAGTGGASHGRTWAPARVIRGPASRAR